MPNEKFNYRDERFRGKIPANLDFGTGFASCVILGGYIELALWDPQRLPPDEHPNINKAVGWKFHVSIDDTDEDNLANGWDIVKDILIEFQIYSSKAVHPAFIPMHERTPPGGAEGDQRGKQITIYAFCQDDGYNWLPVLERITSALAMANVRPSFVPPDCQTITGSHYISYRNDGNQNDTKPGPRGAGFNPLNKQDPFVQLTVNIGNIQQPYVPNWNPQNIIVQVPMG